MNPRLPIVLNKATVAKQLPVIAAISAADLVEPCSVLLSLAELYSEDVLSSCT